jgi:hypothetical protein
LANLKALFMASRQPAEDQYPWPPYGSPDSLPVDATSLRRCEFLCLFWAPGFLNLGWLVACWSLWRRKAVLDPGLAVMMPALGIASALTWVLLMYGPGATVIHQGSYATVLLLFVGLAAWITTLPRSMGYLILAAQGLLFSIGWLFTSPANDAGLLNETMIALSVIFFAVLVGAALGGWRRPHLAPEASAPGKPTKDARTGKPGVSPN